MGQGGLDGGAGDALGLVAVLGCIVVDEGGEAVGDGEAVGVDGLQLLLGEGGGLAEGGAGGVLEALLLRPPSPRGRRSW